MYFEAEILIDPTDVAGLEVPPRPRLRRLLSALRGGWRAATNDQELLVGAVLLQCLRQGLETAGVDDIVRIGRDGELVFHDEQGRPGDLAEAVDGVPTKGGQGFDELRMVMQHHDDELSYVVDLHVARVYPVDGIPIRGYVHGFWRELDATAVPLGRGGDLVSAITDRLRERMLVSPSFDGKDEVPPRFSSTVASLVAAFQQVLPGAKVSSVERVAMLMPRRRITDPAQLPGRVEPDAMAPFSGDPGFAAMVFYAHHWGVTCRAHEVSLRHILIADEAGRPLARVGDEPLGCRRLLALEPGQAFDTMPSLDSLVFTGHDRDAEVREHGLVPPNVERSGLEARLALRQHEMRTLSGYVPTPTPRARATAGSTLGAEVRAAAEWKISVGDVMPIA